MGGFCRPLCCEARPIFVVVMSLYTPLLLFFSLWLAERIYYYFYHQQGGNSTPQDPVDTTSSAEDPPKENRPNVEDYAGPPQTEDDVPIQSVDY